ncbi:Ultraviolet-B receptor UVR8 [Acorus calamus]|uniref:Ultraviolet-B receptor UVR8 n=1 Tax=Acorus calamus TaxID=4465 RepID=A0AAV9E5X3_ACOCL|nr:Ultraviolet-B receptor UVR8 [Acorus calamus]
MAIFQRYPRPEKEYQSFSLIYNDRSLDLICKDKDEAEVWFVGLKALISRGNNRKWRTESKSDRASSDSPSAYTRRNFPSGSPFDNLHKDSGDTQRIQLPYEIAPCNGLGKAFSDVLLYTATAKVSIQSESVSNSLSSLSSGGTENINGRGSAVDAVRVSLSSAVSSSSHGSGHEEFDALGDVFIWGEGIGDGVLGGGMHRVGSLSSSKIDAFLPKPLESAVVLDVHNIACGVSHAALVTRQGEVFTWGEESGGRLGHGADADVPHPKLVNALGGMGIELVACGEYHTCAVTLSGELYSWGDGTHNSGLLGHGSDVSHWIPKKVSGLMEGVHVSTISCGPWHTAVVTSAGQLFTFGDGTFGALGHGDRISSNLPREVETLKGLRTVRVACGVWHSAAVVEIMVESSSGTSSSGKLFTWGDGDKGQLGHGDRGTRLAPECVNPLVDLNFCQVACGNNVTVALTTSGRVYTMGSNVCGQLGNPDADGKLPTCVEGRISSSFVEEIACGSFHVAVLTSRTEVYTWGKGANGRLGHGDTDDRNNPTLVEALRDKQVKTVVCGSNFTAVICLHKWVSGADQSICSGCRLPFGFRRKRHNCYNCGLVFCKACSSRKSLKASLAPNINKPYRVCDECYTKLKKGMESGLISRLPKHQSGSSNHISELAEKDTVDPRPHAQISRLSSVDSFKQAETKVSKHTLRSEMDNRPVPTISNGSFQWGNFYSSKSSNYLSESSKKLVSASVPGSRVTSRATSPVSLRTSPPHSMPQQSLSDLALTDVTGNDLKNTNDDLSQEVIKLRLQVEEFTQKYRLLEDALERKSGQLQEATAVAEEETAKCKAAKEVIKSLTAQLKDLAERVPERGPTVHKLVSMASNTFNIPSLMSSENSASNLAPESNGHTSPPLSNGTRPSTEGPEWVEQDEPGVYITLTSSPEGGKYLKRVRFSRKRFSEKQAEKWWAENRARIHEKYEIVTVEKSNSSLASSEGNDGSIN